MKFVVPIASVALVSAFGSLARAGATPSGCEVILQPEDADPLWQQAVSELKTRLGEWAAGDLDCGAIEVLAAAPQTSVRFTTRDGRRAERPVSAPGGLLAIVQALAITLPEPSPQPDSSSASLPAVGPSKIERDRLPKPAPNVPPSIEATRARFLFGASGGIRVAS
ncbi:MAG: hypothetical protein M3O46_09680, partial [Myxococcota bacterium]|nr:hypothetical protein [Myxococcota bacterium]